jgi:FkbM family methyltransferase
MNSIKRLIFSIYKPVYKLFFGTGIGAYFPLNVLHKFIITHLFPPHVEIDGHRLFVDPGDSLSLVKNVGIYEPFETKLLQQHIRSGDTVLDIGANIGYYSLIFARSVGPAGKIYAFEPDPLNFQLLEKNIEINEYSIIVVIRQAVSDENGTLKLFLCEDNRGDHRIYDSHDNREFIEIESVRIDDFVRDQKITPDFIKMDIQGAEGKAVTGMMEILKANKKIKIATEFWPKGLRRCGMEPATYLKMLEELGYSFYDIMEKQEQIRKTTIDQLLETYDTGDEDTFTNLLCIRD